MLATDRCSDREKQSQQDRVTRQHVIEDLMRQMMDSDVEFLTRGTDGARQLQKA